MKKILSCFITIVSVCFATAQQTDTINEREVARILNFLASDSLRGRANFTKDLKKAADFIAAEFAKDSLSFLPGLHSYFQPFSRYRVHTGKKFRDASGNYDPEKVINNVIGVLPGRSKPEEIIIFSSHYDHMGGKDGGNEDGILNGANDNASGTTAVLALAHYFAKRKDNERTLVFCTFAGEELGLWGSEVLSGEIKPNTIVAMINIEMIGRTNIAGPGSIFLTGSRFSNLIRLLITNLERNNIMVLPDVQADDDQSLYHRSDNYPFAKRGVVAHTIMCSDDRDPCYHQPCDDAASIDLPNMTKVIRSIAIATRSLVDGRDKPKSRR